VEGHVEGLTNSTIYIVTSLDNKIKIDTLFAKEGKFTFVSSYDSVKPIIIYMENQTVWITAWVQNGETITVAGNANDPELIEINGNEINNQLTEFKQQNKKASKDTLTYRAENFIKEHPASIAALVIIQDYLMENEDPNILGYYLSSIESPAKEDVLYARLNAVYHRLLQTSAGNSAPDFSVIDVKGDTLTLESFKDRYLLLAFESFACKGYDENYSILKKLNKKYSKKKLAILSIAFDEDKVDWKKIAEKHNVSWLQVLDRQGLASPLLTLYNVNTLPDYFLMDNQGKIIAAHDSINKIETILTEQIK
jgi:peroxiredoxin